MIKLDITVENISDVLSAGYTLIRVYTDTSETGGFTTLDGTTALVAGQTTYSYVDVDGTILTWYKVAYYGAVPGESSKSEAMQGGTFLAYCTPDEIKETLEITGTAYDARLLKLAEDASKFIDDFCHRPDGFAADAVASARYYNGGGEPCQFIDECVEITEVAVKDSASDTSYVAWDTPTTPLAGDGDWVPFTGDPDFPDFNSLPYTGIMIDPNGEYSTFTSGRYTTKRGFRPVTEVSRGTPTVKVTARWGFAKTVPGDIRQACITQASRWWARGRGGFADTVGGPELGELRYVRKLDPDVEAILVHGRYVRPPVA